MAEQNYLEILSKQRNQVILLVMTAVASFFAYRIYQQQMLEADRIKTQISEEQEKKQSLDSILIYHEKIKKAKQRNWDTLDANKIMEKIFNIGRRSGVNITKIEPGSKREEKNYTLTPFSLVCETTYKTLLKFIRNIETYEMFWRIRSVSTSPLASSEMINKGDLKGDVSLQVSMTLEAIYLK
ncbi:MAG: type 4a pilus biogenesis protein PilO [Candidatus Omnitrophota bacterium]